MTLIVGNDLDTTSALYTNARVRCTKIYNATCENDDHVRDMTLLTDTNYRSILRLLVISSYGNRAQKNECEESEEEE